MAGGVRSPAADVWSLGMTLAEVLTQRLPSWNVKDQADLAVPENLPAPFLEIARGCLRRDPQRRLTIADIAARLGLPLHAASPQPPARAAEAKPLPQERPPVPASAASSRAEPTAHRFAFAGAFAVLALAPLIPAFGLLPPHPQTPPPPPASNPRQNPVS